MGLPSLYSDQISARNNGDERASFYDKQTVKNILASGKTPVIPKNTNLNISASGSSSAGTGGAKSSSKKSSTKTSFDIAKEAKKMKEEAAKQKADQEKKARERIGAAFDPIYSELDRQLSTLPTRQAQYETQIGDLATGQTAAAETARAQSKATLEQSKTQVGEQAQSSLRDLEGDIRNQLKAKVSMLGTASSSSAADAVSEAVTREGLKGRAKILSTRDAAYSDLAQKGTDIDNLATEQLGKIEDWKSSTLFQIGQDFSDKFDALNKEKANASQTEALAIDDRITGLEKDFYSTLNNLDQQVLNYKSSIATWQMQRQAELEDYATKLSMSAKYTGAEDDAKKYSQANDVFNTSLAQGLSAQEAQTRAFQQTGVDPLKGLQLTPELMKQISENAKKANLLLSTDYTTGQPIFIDKNNPQAGYTPVLPATQVGQSAPAATSPTGGGLFQSILGALSGNK